MKFFCSFVLLICISYSTESSSFEFDDGLRCLLGDQNNHDIILDYNKILELSICNDLDLKEIDLFIGNQENKILIDKNKYIPSIYFSGETNLDDGFMNNSSNLSLNWLLYDFGRKSNEYRKENFTLNSMYERKRSVTLRNIENNLKLYLDLVFLRKELDLYFKREIILKKNHDIAKDQYEHGIGLLSDVLMAESSINSVRSDIFSNINYRNQTELSLKSALGYFNYNFMIVEDENFLNKVDNLIFNSSKDEILNEIEISNPEIIKIKEEIKSIKENILLINKNNYPKFYFGSSFYLTKSNIDKVWLDDMSFYFKLESTIFDGFKNKYEKRYSENDINIKINEMNRVKLKLIKEFYEKYENFIYLNNQIKNLKNDEKVLIKLNEISLFRYKNGVGSMFEVLESNKKIDELNQKMNKNILELNKTRLFFFLRLYSNI